MAPPPVVVVTDPFWQQLVISVLGTVGSLLIAAVFYKLGRRSAEDADRDARYRENVGLVLDHLRAVYNAANRDRLMPEDSERLQAALQEFTPMVGPYARGILKGQPADLPVQVAFGKVQLLNRRFATRNIKGEWDAWQSQKAEFRRDVPDLINKLVLAREVGLKKPGVFMRIGQR